MIIIVLAVALLTACSPQPAYNGRKAAGVVNGEPFFQEDLNVYGLELRAAVAKHYGAKYNLSGMGASFWDTKYDGTTPRETITALAMDDLVRNIVLIQEARRRGIDAPKTYHDLETERTEWNTPTGEIVYGPKTFAPAEYNSYRISAIRDELKTALLKKELSPKESQLREIFAAIPDEMKRAPHTAFGVVFKWDDADRNGEVIAAVERELRMGLLPEGVFNKLSGSFPDLRTEDFEFNSRYVSKEDAYDQELAQLMADAVPGSVIRGPQGWPALYYVQKKEGGYALAFEEAPLLARNKWINEQFDLFLDKRVRKARVKLYTQVEI